MVFSVAPKRSQVLEWFEASGGQDAALAAFSTAKLPFLEGVHFTLTQVNRSSTFALSRSTLDFCLGGHRSLQEEPSDTLWPSVPLVCVNQQFNPAPS